MQPRVDVGRSFAVRVMGPRGSEEPPGNPDPYRQQSMILVPLPHPGVVVKRMLLSSATTRRRMAMPRWSSTRSGSRRRTYCSAKDSASRSPRAGCGPAASTTHAADRAD